MRSANVLVLVCCGPVCIKVNKLSLKKFRISQFTCKEEAGRARPEGDLQQLQRTAVAGQTQSYANLKLFV